MKSLGKTPPNVGGHSGVHARNLEMLNPTKCCDTAQIVSTPQYFLYNTESMEELELVR